MRLSKVLLPLLVGTAHGLNGLWPEAVTKPVESYPGSSNDCHDGLSFEDRRDRGLESSGELNGGRKNGRLHAREGLGGGIGGGG